jgi:hypothetical protein
MQSFQESLTGWATLFAAFVSFVGLIQSRTWLAGIGAFCLIGSVITGVYARRERRIVNSAAVKIEGQNIDSLNIANLRRRVNRSLVIQEADHVAAIESEELKVTWRYSGYCKEDVETSIEFSIDSDNPIPFNQLDCFAYDLQRDPFMRHKIRPLLVGADGVSKKVAVPFLRPLRAGEPFGVLLECRLPGCMKAGLEYYTSTMSFAPQHLPRCSTRLIFTGDCPTWVRVYECGASGDAKLRKDLPPLRQGPQFAEYLDASEDTEAQSIRIYAFRRFRWPSKE